MKLTMNRSLLQVLYANILALHFYIKAKAHIHTQRPLNMIWTVEPLSPILVILNTHRISLGQRYINFDVTLLTNTLTRP